MPVVHIVALRFHEEWYAPGRLERHFREEADLKNRMPDVVLDWGWSENHTLDSRRECNLGMTHVVWVECKDEAALREYIAHPQHEEVKRIQGPMVKDKFVVDITKQAEAKVAAPSLCDIGSYTTIVAGAAAFALGMLATSRRS